MRLASQHYCVHRGNPAAGFRHTEGKGKPTRKSCRYCGGNLVTEHGRYHLFEHRSDGRYFPADSLGDFTSQAAADARGRELNQGEYLASYNSGHGVVTRWEIYEPCDRCGTEAAYRTAWEHKRLCPACRDHYLALIELWHATLPVTVGKGVQTPGHTVEVPRLTLVQLDSVVRSQELCKVCFAYSGELHETWCEHFLPEGEAWHQQVPGHSA